MPLPLVAGMDLRREVPPERVPVASVRPRVGEASLRDERGCSCERWRPLDLFPLSYAATSRPRARGGESGCGLLDFCPSSRLLSYGGGGLVRADRWRGCSS